MHAYDVGHRPEVPFRDTYDTCADVVNPDGDTSLKVLAARIAELEGDDDWVELRQRRLY